MAQGRIKFGIDFEVNKANLATLQNELQKISKLTVADLKLQGIDIAQKELEALQREANELSTIFAKSYNFKLNTVDFEKLRKNLNDSNISIAAFSTQARALGGDAALSVQKLNAAIYKTQTQLKESTSWAKKMSDTFANTIRWSAASTAINAISGAVQRAWGFTKSLDNSLNDIRIVTGKNADEMERFARQANNAAKALGASTKAYTDAALIYYQQGLSEADVQARSGVTVKAANVTGQSARSVSEQLTAVWNGYKVSAREAELYIDKLSAVAATTAADLEELSIGMSRVASAANIMGVDVDQLSAQLATIVSITREAPESIGTALKTVYARMSDIESGLDAETTLGEYTKQMKKFGINALDTQDNLRNMGDVIEEIGSKWETFNRNQQTALAQTIAGTRQYSRMMALFDNWDMYQSSKNTSIGSAGELQKQQEIYLDSLEAKIEKLTASTEQLYIAFVDNEGIKELIDGFTTLVDLAGKFVDTVGGGAPILLSLGGILASKVGSEFLGETVRTSLTNRDNKRKNQEQVRAMDAHIKEEEYDFENPAEAAAKWKKRTEEAQAEVDVYSAQLTEKSIKVINERANLEALESKIAEARANNNKDAVASLEAEHNQQAAIIRALEEDAQKIAHAKTRAEEMRNNAADNAVFFEAGAKDGFSDEDRATLEHAKREREIYKTLTHEEAVARDERNAQRISENEILYNINQELIKTEEEKSKKIKELSDELERINAENITRSEEHAETLLRIETTKNDAIKKLNDDQLAEQERFNKNLEKKLKELEEVKEAAKTKGKLSKAQSTLASQQAVQDEALETFKQYARTRSGTAYNSDVQITYKRGAQSGGNYVDPARAAQRLTDTKNDFDTHAEVFRKMSSDFISGKASATSKEVAKSLAEEKKWLLEHREQIDFTQREWEEVLAAFKEYDRALKAAKADPESVGKSVAAREAALGIVGSKNKKGIVSNKLSVGSKRMGEAIISLEGSVIEDYRTTQEEVQKLEEKYAEQSQAAEEARQQARLDAVEDFNKEQQQSYDEQLAKIKKNAEERQEAEDKKVNAATEAADKRKEEIEEETRVLEQEAEKQSRILQQQTLEHENNVANLDAEDLAQEQSAAYQRLGETIAQTTGGIMQMGAALASVTSLWDLWQNDSVSAGEKVLKSIIAIAAATGTAASGFKQLKEATSTASTLFSTYIAKKIAADKISQKENLVTAATEVVRKKAVEASTKATEKSTVAQGVENAMEKKTQANNLKTALGSFKDPKGSWGQFFGKGSGGSFGKLLGGIAAVAGAIAIVVTSTVVAFKLVENAEKKQEEAAKKAEAQSAALKQQLSETQTKAQELERSISNLSSLEDQMKGLTQGTIEWSQALTDINAEVLKLLKTYPELSKYVTTNAQGILTIEQQGLDIVQKKQLEEVREAQAASYAADMHAQEERIALLREDLSEKATGSFENQAGAAAATVGSMAGLGAGIGAFAGPIGALIGAGIGAIAGAVTATGAYHIQENKEDNFNSRLTDNRMNALTEAYLKNGEAIFTSYDAFAEALGKDVTALTATERALLENKEATLKLVDEMARYKAGARTQLLEIGTALMGEDASTGAKITAGTRYNEIYENSIDHYTRYADRSTEKAAKEALVAMGLSSSALVSAKDKDNITYLDREGNEKKLTVATIAATLAKESAENQVKNQTDQIAEKFEKALIKLETEELRNIVSEIGLEGYNLNNTSYDTFQKVQTLDAQTLQLVADAQGKSFEEIKDAWIKENQSAMEAWSKPASLTGQALEKFNSIVSNVDISSTTLSSYTGFAASFEKIWEKFGDVGVDTVYTMLAQAGDKSDEVLNTISTIDWTAEDAASQLFSKVHTLGANIDTNLLTDFMSMMRNVNGLYGETAESLRELNASFKSMTETLTTGNIISKETYEELVKKVGVENIDKFFTKLSENEYMLTGSGTALRQTGLKYIQNRMNASVTSDYQRLNEINKMMDTIEADAEVVENAKNKEREVTAQYGASITDEQKFAAQAIIAGLASQVHDKDFQEKYNPIQYYDMFSEGVSNIPLDRVLDDLLAAKMISEGDYNILKKHQSGNYLNEDFRNEVDDYDLGNNDYQELTNRFYASQLLLGKTDYINAGSLHHDEWKQDQFIAQYNRYNLDNALTDVALFKQAADARVKVAEEVKKVEDNYREKYGDKTMAELNAEKEKVEKNIVESANSLLSTATSFDELETIVETVKTNFGIDYEANKENLENFYKEVQRVGIQTYQNIADMAGLSVEALTAYIGVQEELNNQSLTGIELISKYKEAFEDLLTTTNKWDAAIETGNKNIDKLEKALPNLAGVSYTENLKAQVAEAEKIISALEGDEQNPGKLQFVENQAKKRIKAITSNLLEELKIAGLSIEGIDTETLVSSLFNEDGSLNKYSLGEFKDFYFANIGSYADDAGIQKSFSSIFDLAEQYGSDYDNMQQELSNAEQARLDKNLEILDKNLEAKYEELEIQESLNETAKLFLKEDDFDARYSLVQSNLTQTEERIKANNAQQKLLDEAYKKQEISMAEYLARSKALLEDTTQSVEELSSTYEELTSIQQSAIENVNTLYQRQLDAHESIIDTLTKEHQLQQLLYGDEAKLDYEQIVGQSKNRVDDAKAQADYWLSLINSETFSQQSKEYQDAVKESYRNAAQEVVNYTADLMEARQKDFINKSEQLIKDFEKRLLPDGATLKGIAEEWDWTKQMDDKYLDTIENSFAQGRLKRAFEESARNMTNPKALAEINDLHKRELAYLEKKGKLTQQDYDRALAKLKVLEAEIALEDARDSKTQMRLMRSSSGVYSYQYVANAEDVMKKEEELQQAQEDLYTKDKEAYQKNLDEFYRRYTEYKAAQSEALKDYVISEEERAALDAQYQQLFDIAKENKFYAEQLQETASDFSGELGAETALNLTNTSSKIQTFLSNLKDNKVEFQDMQNDMEELGNTYKEELEKDSETASTVSSDILASYQEIISEMSGEDGLLATAQAEQIAVSQLSVSLGTLNERYQDLSISIATLTKAYGDLRKVENTVIAPSISASAQGALSGMTLNQQSNTPSYNLMSPPSGGSTEGGNGAGGGEPGTIIATATALTKKNGVTDKIIDGANGKGRVAGLFDSNIKIIVGENTYSGLSIYDAAEDASFDSEIHGKVLLTDINSEAVKQLNAAVLQEGYTRPEENSVAVYDNIAYIYRFGKWRAILTGDPEKAVKDNSPEDIRFATELVSAILKNVASADTGGYTGEWGAEGKLLKVHEKELVLNKTDTRNILEAVDIVRSLNASMLKTTSGLGGGYDLSMAAWELAKELVIEQTVHINAEFPNATDRSEIEAAFEELMLLATQHAFDSTKD